MGMEIERKFLVANDAWRKDAVGVLIRQGYLHNDARGTVRIRTCGNKGFLTVKGRSSGIVRQEFEYEIPFDDARTMLDDLAEKPLVEKIRYTLPVNGLVWEIDEFMGENAGLVIAEVELDSPDVTVSPPSWAGKEVSDDARYYNANLVRNPYKNWKR